MTCFDFSHLFAKAWYKAMTAPNIISGFKATGVCPFDRSAICLPGIEKEERFSTFKPESLAQRTRLAYIPLCRDHSSSVLAQEMVACSTPRKPFYHCTGGSFSDSELYPCEKSPRKNLLLESFSHDESLDTSLDNVSTFVPLRRATSASKFLIPPLPPSKAPAKHGKSSGCVLTSIENIQRIAEKEKQKLEEAQRKEERKR